VDLDPDVRAAAEALRREPGLGLSEAVNELARAGIIAFLRLVTSPRVLQRPLAAAEAWGYVEDWLAVGHGLAVCSADGDFARLGVRWENPLDGG
jgi:hypothetical protein